MTDQPQPTTSAASQPDDDWREEHPVTAPPQPTTSAAWTPELAREVLRYREGHAEGCPAFRRLPSANVTCTKGCHRWWGRVAMLAAHVEPTATEPCAPHTAWRHRGYECPACGAQRTTSEMRGVPDTSIDLCRHCEWLRKKLAETIAERREYEEMRDLLAAFASGVARSDTKFDSAMGAEFARGFTFGVDTIRGWIDLEVLGNPGKTLEEIKAEQS